MFPFAPIWRPLYSSQVSSRENLLRIPQNYLLAYLSEVKMPLRRRWTSNLDPTDTHD